MEEPLDIRQTASSIDRLVVYGFEGHKAPWNPYTKENVSHKSFPVEHYDCCDEVVQTVSEEKNSHLTHLFDKVIKPSDINRAARLVIPRCHAECFFPQLSESKNIYLSIQDWSGKEQIFGYGYYGESAKRQYYLKPVKPSVRDLQLQAGDIVRFWQTYPEGKLVVSILQHKNQWSDVDKYLRNFQVPKTAPNIFVVDGYEFEEYEDPPMWNKEVTSNDNSSCASELLGAVKIQRTDDLKIPRRKDTDSVPLPVENVTRIRKHPRHKEDCKCVVCSPLYRQRPIQNHLKGCPCSSCVLYRKRYPQDE